MVNRIFQGNSEVVGIVVHQATTRPDWYADKSVKEVVKEIDRWHKGEGWRDIGYHYVIHRDGSVGVGRPETQVGAHVARHNSGTLGICLVGGYGASNDDAFSDNFTPEQDNALRELIDDIQSRARIKWVKGHSSFANKVCPGFDVERWLKGKPPTRHVVESTTVQASGLQLTTAAGGAAAAVAALDGQAQIVALCICTVMALGAAWIMRERLLKWARGVK